MIATPDRSRWLRNVPTWPLPARLGAVLILVAVTTGIIALVNGDRGWFTYFNIENPGTVYIVTVTLAAVLYGFSPALLATVASMLAVFVFFARYENPERAVVLVGTMLIISALAEWQRRAQVRAERAQAKFEAIVESMSDAVMVVDVAGHATDVNHAAVAMLGAPNRVQALQFVTHLREDGSPFTDEYALLLRALAGEGTSQKDVLIPNDTGDFRTVSAVASPMHDGRGQIIGAVSVSRDITDRVREAREREELLKQVERERQYHQHVLENLPVGIAVVRADNYTVLSFNREYDAAIRRAPGAHPLRAGQPLLDAMPPASHDPATRLLTRARDEQTMIRSTAYAAAVVPDQFYDGTIEPLELTDGTAALLITSVNVTDRVRAEQEREQLLDTIEQERRNTELILDTAPVAIGVLRPDDLMVLSANTGFRAAVSDLAGQPCAVGGSLLEILPGFEVSEFIRQLRQAVAEDRTVSVTGYAARYPENRYYDWTMQPLTMRDGTRATLAMFADVTERVENEQERETLLRQVERQAAQLEATFEAMLDGIAVYDADGNVLHRNEAFYRLLHLDLDHAPALWDDFIQEMNLRKADGALMKPEETHSFRALRGETVREEVVRVRDMLGRDRSMRQNASPIRAADGTIIGAVVVFNDETERLEQEREREQLLTLVEERRRFAQAIFDTVPVTLAVVDTNTLTFSAANPAFLEGTPEPYRWLGVNGRAVTTVLPHTRENGFVDQLRRVGENGEPFVTPATAYMHPTRGETYWNETMVPLTMTEPNVRHVLYIAADVTEQIQGQQRIAALAQEAAERAGQLEAVFRALTEGLILTDAQGTIVRSNEAVGRILGLDGQLLPPLNTFGERFLMRDAQDILIPQAQRVALAALEGATSTDQVRRFRNARGEERWMSISASPVHDEAGTIAGVAMTMRDVTEERRGIEERERLLREVEEGRRFAQTVIESAPVGIAVFGADPDFTARIVNNQFLRILDEPWRSEGITGVGVRAYLPRAEEAGIIRAIRSVIETGEPVFVHEFGYDGFARGTAYFDWSIVPLREDGAHVTGLLALITEVTDRVLSRQRIEELADAAAQRAAELETMIASMPDGVAIAALDGRLLLMNDAGYQITGVERSASGALSAAFADQAMYYPDGRPLPLDDLPLPRALRGERVTGFEFIAHTPHRDLPLLASSAPIRDASGTITSAVVIFSDITERKRQEELATRLGRILDASSNEIYVYDATSLRYVQVNAGARRNLGYTVDELMQMTALDLKPEFTAESFATLLAPLRMGERNEIVFESVHRRKDGSLYPVEARVQRSQSENPPVFVSIVQDITERRAAEQQREQLLREIDERRRDAAQRASELETVIASIADGVMFTDTQGRIVLENDAARRLIGRENADENDAFIRADRFRDPSGAPMRYDALPLARALRGETVADQVMMVWRADLAEDRFLMGSSGPVRTADGTITGAVAILRDITEMKQLEQMKDEFVSIAAHELRTPLTAIKGYADLLDRRLSAQGGRETDRRSLAVIRKQTDRLAGLVNEMLDVSRIEAGRLQLNIETFDLSVLVQEVVGNMSVSSETHIFTLAAEPGIAVNGDMARIEQVLLNLISNAITYSPNGGDVDVRVWAKDGAAHVAVRDEGVGITQEELPYLFDRFYRAPHAGVMRSGGMGLGLYICREIIARHGGTIRAESTPSVGSTFTFSLPLAGEGLSAED